MRSLRLRVSQPWHWMVLEHAPPSLRYLYATIGAEPTADDPMLLALREQLMRDDWLPSLAGLVLDCESEPSRYASSWGQALDEVTLLLCLRNQRTGGLARLMRISAISTSQEQFTARLDELDARGV